MTFSLCFYFIVFRSWDAAAATLCPCVARAQMWLVGIAYFLHTEPVATLGDAMLLATGIGTPSHGMCLSGPPATACVMFWWCLSGRPGPRPSGGLQRSHGAAHALRADGGFVRLYAILWPIFLQTFMLGFIATGTMALSCLLLLDVL
jgi:hypothetical protein